MPVRHRQLQTRCMVCLVLVSFVHAKIEALDACSMFPDSGAPRSSGARRPLFALLQPAIPGRSGFCCKTPFSVFVSPLSSFRWRVESRLQSPQFPSLSHGCFICKACRPVESEGPCARFPAVSVGWSGRQLVGCRRCRDTVVRRGVRRQILEVLRRGRTWKAWFEMGGSAVVEITWVECTGD
jgi:hypothetical protein